MLFVKKAVTKSYNDRAHQQKAYNYAYRGIIETKYNKPCRKQGKYCAAYYNFVKKPFYFAVG